MMDLPDLAASIMGAARHYTHDHEMALKITRLALYEHDVGALLDEWRKRHDAGLVFPIPKSEPNLPSATLHPYT
jgi:hypothetical protein